MFEGVWSLGHKMQLETADFAPVPPPDELDKTCVVFGSNPLYENMMSSTKLK